MKKYLFVVVIVLSGYFSLFAFAEEVTQEKDVYYFFNKNSKEASSEPNWFHFWSQFLPKGRINTLAYDSTLPGYASTNPATRETSVSSKASEDNDETGHRGIHTFYETLAHESYHIVLWEGWWPTGYDPSKDNDGDFYPDAWETSNPEAINYKFRPPGEAGAEKDRYDYEDPKDPNYLSPGYIYEEAKCRAVEHALDETAYDDQDWSYDPTGVNQGKMWLKLP